MKFVCAGCRRESYSSILPCIWCGRKAWIEVPETCPAREVHYRSYWEYEDFWRGRLGEPVPWEE